MSFGMTRKPVKHHQMAVDLEALRAEEDQEVHHRHQ